MISAEHLSTTATVDAVSNKSQSAASNGFSNGHHDDGDAGQPMETDNEVKKETTNGVVVTNGDHGKVLNGHHHLDDGDEEDEAASLDLKTKKEVEEDEETQQQLKKLKILDERNEAVAKLKSSSTSGGDKRDKYLRLKQLELDLKKEEAQLMLFKRLYYSQRLAPSAANPNTQQRNGIMNKGLQANKQQYLMQNQRGGNMNNMQLQQQNAVAAGLLNKPPGIRPPPGAPNAAVGSLNRGIPGVPVPPVAGAVNRQSPQIPPPGQRLNNLANSGKVPPPPPGSNKMNPAAVTNGRNQGANSPMNLGNSLASIMAGGGLPPVPSSSLMSPQAAYNPSVSPGPSPAASFPPEYGKKGAPLPGGASISQLVRKEYERSLAQIELPKGPAQDIYFIPSANQMEFLMCLGLEEVVKCVHEQMSAKQAREREKAEKEKAEAEMKKENGGAVELKREPDSSSSSSRCVQEIQYRYPLLCASCSTDWTTVWRKDKNGLVLCDRCLKIAERKQIKSEHNARLKQAFAKAAKDKEAFEKQLLERQPAAVAATPTSNRPSTPTQPAPSRDLLMQQQQQQRQQPRNSPQVGTNNMQRNTTPSSSSTNKPYSPHLNSHSNNNNNNNSYQTPNTSSNHHHPQNSASRNPQNSAQQHQQQQQQRSNRMPMEPNRPQPPQQSTPKNVNPGKPMGNSSNSSSNPRMNQNHHQNHMTPPNQVNSNKGKATPNDMQQQRQRGNNSSMNHHHTASPSNMHQGGSNSLKSSSSQSNLANNSSSSSSSSAAMVAAFQQQLAAMQGAAAAAAASGAANSSSNNPLMAAFAQQQQQQQQQQLLRLMAQQSPNYNPLLAGFQSNQAAQAAFNYLNSMSAPVQPKQWKP